jgi:hypothetical protein
VVVRPRSAAEPEPVRFDARPEEPGGASQRPR